MFFNPFSPKGFTIVELVVALTLLSILSITAVAFMADPGVVTSEAAARRLLADLSYARRLAYTRNATYSVTFNAVADSYTVSLYDPVSGLETAIPDPLTQQEFTVDFTQTPGLQGIDLQTPNFGGTDTVRFTPQGQPQNGLNALLVVAGQVSLQGGGRTITLSVQPNTGEVSAQ